MDRTEAKAKRLIKNYLYGKNRITDEEKAEMTGAMFLNVVKAFNTMSLFTSFMELVCRW